MSGTRAQEVYQFRLVQAGRKEMAGPCFAADFGRFCTAVNDEKEEAAREALVQIGCSARTIYEKLGGETAAFVPRMLTERYRQDCKWGVQTHGGHTWAAILGEEIGEFCEALESKETAEAIIEAVQVAAVACAAFEQSLTRAGLRPQWGTFTKDEQ